MLREQTKEIMVMTSNITITFRSQDNKLNSLVMCPRGTQRAQIHSLFSEPLVGRSILTASNVIIRICMVPYDTQGTIHSKLSPHFTGSNCSARF